ncbi:MAG: hypothetical protein ACYDDA_14710 [Acidiferrobacteraceae bacterium]
MSEWSLREHLVEIALRWQDRYGVAPAITSALAEHDAARLVGLSEAEYTACMTGRTAVAQGTDFAWQGRRYQVKANRPSGAPGSRVTLVPKAHNYDWDSLIWILYDRRYDLQEAWQWPVDAYKKAFHDRKRLSPADYRRGMRLA